MPFDVTLQPSGKQFRVEASETLLDAGLREGVNLEHSCANGSCGACRARLLSGDLTLTRHYDYRITEQEKQENYFLMCCHRPASAVEILVHEAGHADEIAEQHIRAKVAKVERLQPDILQLHVRTPRSRNLHFLAGQAVRLSFDGMRPVTLHLANCPCDGMNLRFHLRRKPHDSFSDFIFDRLKKGREVVVTGPTGRFNLDEENTRPRFFVAWETGFAPISSLIEHAIQLDDSRASHLYWLSAFPAGHYLSNAARAWRDALDDFHYHAIDLQTAADSDLLEALDRIAAERQPLQDWDRYLTLPASLRDKLPPAFADAHIEYLQDA